MTDVRPRGAIVYDHPEPGYQGNEEDACHHVPFDHTGEASRHVRVTIDVELRSQARRAGGGQSE